MKDDIKSICAYITFNLIWFGLAYGATMGPNSKNEVTIVVCGIFGALAPYMGRDFAEEIAEHSKVVSVIFVLGHLILMIYVLFIRKFLLYGNTLTGWAIGGIIGYFMAVHQHEQIYK